ncbi:hypothetical protein ABIA27_002251 [Sinorhizobium fredii]
MSDVRLFSSRNSALRRSQSSASRRGHAHRLDDLGIALRGLGEGVAQAARLGRLPGGSLRAAIGEIGEKRQDQAATDRHEADHRMKQEADGDIEGKPGQIEQRRRPGTGEERANLIEVAQRLKPVALHPELQGRLHHRPIDAAAQALVERAGNAHQHAPADQLEGALEGVEQQSQQAERNQRGNAAARQNPIVDLEHEERAGEIEDIDERTGDADADKGGSAISQGGGGIDVPAIRYC